MRLWTFKIFGENESDVDDWIKNLPPKAHTKMDHIINNLESIRDWTRTGFFSPLTGYNKINEIKVSHRGEEYRPLGCYGPGNNEFTILIGAKEQGDRFNPISAPLIAVKRRKILEGRELTHEY